MHEMSLVQGLLQQLHGLADEHGKTKVVTVTMEIGPLAGIVMDSFQFGFDILAGEDSLTREARLIVESPLAIYRCCSCGEKTEAEQRPECCSVCSETLLSTEGSEDLLLLRVEME